MARVTVTWEDFKKLMSRFDCISPKRYFAVVTGEKVILVPVKSSRHLHYYEIGGCNTEQVRRELQERGFTVVEGDVVFLPT